MSRASSLYLSLALLALLSGCQQADRKSAPESQVKAGTLKVVATTNIAADLVREIGGDAVQLHALMGPGIDPHLYKATEGDVSRLSAADLIVYNGLHLEGKMAELFADMNRLGRKTVALADGLEKNRLLRVSTAADVSDPHIWMDIQLWQAAAEYLTGQLKTLAPAQHDIFAANLARYRVELQALHAYAVSRAAELEPSQRLLVTAHDAFGYFGRAYGFDVHGLLGVSTASEAGTADVGKLAHFIVAHKVPAIFVESTISDRYLRALQEAVESQGKRVAIGGQLYSDALGEPGGPAGTYIGMLRWNVDTIVNALRP